MIANATAIKLAALSTVNNRIALGDVSSENTDRQGRMNLSLRISQGVSAAD
jgi:hypothetical protein